MLEQMSRRTGARASKRKRESMTIAAIEYIAYNGQVAIKLGNLI
jgi:hypothetical protein